MDEDFNTNPETTLDDAVEAFMKAPQDVEELSDDDVADEQEALEADEYEEDVEDDEEDEDPGLEADDDDEEAEDNEEPLVADDAAEAIVTVDGKEHRVSVADLKRLYGQEASLTTKSQALADQRRIVEAQGVHVAQILQRQYEAAQKEAEKYKDVDLFRASRELDPDDFDALRAAKENADNHLAALQREGQEFLQRSQETRQTLLREQAKESLKEITKAIPEWSDELYGQIRTYAVSQGMDVEDANSVIEPAAIVMMHKAMKYDEVQSAKPRVKKKVTKAPKKVVRKGDSKTDTKASKLKAKRKMVMDTGGDVDAVADLFMSAYSE